MPAPYHVHIRFKGNTEEEHREVSEVSTSGGFLVLRWENEELEGMLVPAARIEDVAIFNANEPA